MFRTIALAAIASLALTGCIKHEPYGHHTEPGPDNGGHHGGNTEEKVVLNERSDWSISYVTRIDDVNEAGELEQWERLSDKERMLVMPHIRAYVGSRDLVYQRDFERYLRDKVFMDTIVVGKRVVYDPSHVTNDTNVVYRPMTDGMIHWNDGLGCYLFTGFDETCIFDGYDDANRPDGAMLCMNNGRGYVSWDAKAGKWVRKGKP